MAIQEMPVSYSYQQTGEVVYTDNNVPQCTVLPPDFELQISKNINAFANAYDLLQHIVVPASFIDQFPIIKSAMKSFRKTD